MLLSPNCVYAQSCCPLVPLYCAWCGQHRGYPLRTDTSLETKITGGSFIFHPWSAPYRPIKPRQPSVSLQTAFPFPTLHSLETQMTSTNKSRPHKRHGTGRWFVLEEHDSSSNCEVQVLFIGGSDVYVLEQFP